MKDSFFKIRCAICAGLFAVCVILSILNISYFHNNNEKEISYSDLLFFVRAHQIEKVTIVGDVAKAYIPKESKPKYIIYLVEDQSILLKELDKNEVLVETSPARNYTIQYFLIATIAIIGIVIIALILFTRVTAQRLVSKLDMYIDGFKEIYLDKHIQLLPQIDERQVQRSAIDVTGIVKQYKLEHPNAGLISSNDDYDYYDDFNDYYEEFDDMNELEDEEEYKRLREIYESSSIPDNAFDATISDDYNDTDNDYFDDYDFNVDKVEELDDIADIQASYEESSVDEKSVDFPQTTHTSNLDSLNTDLGSPHEELSNKNDAAGDNPTDKAKLPHNESNEAKTSSKNSAKNNQNSQNKPKSKEQKAAPGKKKQATKQQTSEQRMAALLVQLKEKEGK